MNRIIANPDLRRWIYGIATAGLGVLLVYGVDTGEQAAAWSGLAMAATGLAMVNTPRS